VDDNLLIASIGHRPVFEGKFPSDPAHPLMCSVALKFGVPSGFLMKGFLIMICLGSACRWARSSLVSERKGFTLKGES